MNGIIKLDQANTKLRIADNACLIVANDLPDINVDHHSSPVIPFFNPQFRADLKTLSKRNGSRKSFPIKLII